LIWRLFVCAVSGALLVLAFPAFGLSPLAWVALVPLILAVKSARGPAGGFFCGWFSGFIFFLGLLYWVRTFGNAPWILLAVFQGFFVGVFGFLAYLIGRRGGGFSAVALASAWTLTEGLRSLGMLGFTWGDLAYSQAGFLPVAQVASLAGAWGVTFLIALVNALLAEAYESRAQRAPQAKWQLLAAVVVVGGAAGWGWWHLSRPLPAKGRLTVGICQGGISSSYTPEADYYREAYTTYWRMTRQAARKGADLVIWPETSMPGEYSADVELQRRIGELAKGLGVSILAGGFDSEDQVVWYNAAFLIGSDGELADKYRKVKTVPFGESLPADFLDPIVQHWRVRGFYITPGAGYHTIEACETALGPLVCFESTFGYITRRLREQGAAVLVVITNDAWYDWTAEPAQHEQFSVFRAIESGAWLARAATTGISCLIDPHGRVIAKVPARKSGVIVGWVSRVPVETLYVGAGAWIFYLVGAFAVVGIARSASHRQD
jgi:apolipoprotein N-acyltransferase